MHPKTVVNEKRNLDSYLSDSQDLPLHKAILNGHEEEACKLIREAGRFNKAREVGILIKDFELRDNQVIADGRIEFIQTSSKYKNGKYSQGYIDNSSKELILDDPNLGKVVPPIAIRIGLDPNNTLVLDTNKNNLELKNKFHQQAAIHLAVEKNQISVVNALIAKGININLKDGYGRTALHYAVQHGYEKLVICLLEAGADIYITDQQFNLAPVEMISPNTGFKVETVKLLCDKDPRDDANKRLKPNSLHQWLYSEDNEEFNILNKLNKDLSVLRYLLIKDKDAILPSELAKKRGFKKLANLLSQHEFLQSLNSRYQQSLYTSFKWETQEKDAAYLPMLYEAVNFMQDLPKDKYEFDLIIVKNLFRFIGTFAHNISQQFKASVCDQIPWPNLEFLRYLSAADDPCYKKLLNQHLENFLEDTALVEALNAILNDKDNWYKENKNRDAIGMNGNMQALYQLTIPAMDLRSLNKMLHLSNLILTIIKNPDSKEKRYAIFGAFKKLAELTNYTNLSPNLSAYAKELFEFSGWKTLRDIRSILAKIMGGDDAKKNYFNFVNNGNNELFSKLSTDLDSFIQEINSVIAAYQTVIDKGELIDFTIDPSIKLNQEEIKKLGDIVDVWFENLKNQQKAQFKYSKIKEAIDKGTLTKEESNYLSTIIDQEDKRNSTSNKQAWKNRLESKFTFFKNEMTSKKNENNNLLLSNLELTKALLLDLGSVIFGDELFKKYKKNPEQFFQEQSDLCALRNQLKNFENNDISILAAQQLFTHIHPLLETLAIPSNKQLRNYLEHLNPIYETADKPLDREQFFEFLSYIRTKLAVIEACIGSEKEKSNELNMSV